MRRIRTIPEVTNFELFYDLIFAFAISKISAVLHVTEHGQISLINLAEYLMMTLVFWSIWTYQTVYANRFYRENLSNIIFLLFDMFWVVILSQSLTLNFASTQFTFAGSTGLLFLSLSIQYLISAAQNQDAAPKKLCREMGILLLAIGIVDLATAIPVVPFRIEFPIYAVTIFIAGFFPLAMRKTLINFPTQFEHLTERYSLFVMLLFGEGVIAVATSVHLQHFSWLSALFFVTLVLLFSFYILSYQSGLNRHQQTAALVLIHLHYFVFVATLWIAASLELYLASELQLAFFIGWFDLSLWLLIGSVTLILYTYQRATVTLRAKQLWQVLIWLALWLPIGALTVGNQWLFMGSLVVYLGAFLAYWWYRVLARK